MSNTLKQRYIKNKINEVTNKAVIAEKILKEGSVNYHARLLIEALDADEFEKATETIEKLNNILDTAKTVGLNSVAKAISTAISEINKFTGGDTGNRLKSRLASIFSKSPPAKNPILKGVAFANSLETGFKQLPTILKNNIKDFDKIAKDPASKDKTLEELAGDATAQKNIQNSIVKAFAPSGTFGKVFSKMPYLENPAEFTGELLKIKPSSLTELMKPVQQLGTQNIDPTVTDQKAAAEVAKEQGQEGGESKGGAEKGAAKGQPGQANQPVVVPGAPPGQAPKDEKAKKQNVDSLQNSAKEAGITDSSSLRTLLKKLDYEVGSPQAAYVVPQLKSLLDQVGLEDDQSSGFIRGLMSDFEKDFKQPIQAQIQKEIEKREKELASMKSKETPKTSGGQGKAGGQGGAGGT